jgi:signal transduction histidine kinase
MSLLCPCRAEHPGITSVAEIRALRDFSATQASGLSLTGVVTMVDADRDLFVLQDATGAVALHAELSEISVQPGQRVSLKAAACAPYVASVPDFPFRPSGRDVQPMFEIPVNEGNFRLTRMRAWLQPPATGNYRFWIASDDSSELWLSPGEDAWQARRIGFVPTSGWTDRGDWSRFPSQRSDVIFLQAGERYYIEALHEQQLEQGNLSVAWEGPTLKQTVIDGRFMVPWREDGERAAADSSADRGVLREFWTDYSASSLEPLRGSRAVEMGLTLRGIQVAVIDEGVWPDPRPFEPGRQLESEDVCRWVEGEGSVKFLASDGTSATLEMVVGGRRVLVRVVRWQGNLPTLSPRLHARFRGVWEGVDDANAHLNTGLVAVPSEQQLSFFEGPAEESVGDGSPLLDPVAAGPGGYFFTRGVVTFNDLVGGKECIFIQDARNGIFVSQEERQIRRLLQVGQVVQMGGPLMPGKFAPGISPASLRIVGWQNLPAPAIPSAEDPAASYRDGQWTEIEGVARAVNADGSVLLMGKKAPLLVWVGRTERENLESLVSSTLRLRGVMSLELFESPALLVPSRNYVEVMEPARKLPAKPVPLGDLIDSGSESGWPHLVKVAGTVTHLAGRSFFIQDEAGGVRVEPLDEIPLSVGMSVQVVGFPGRQSSAVRLTEATWQPLDANLPVVPATLDPRHPDPARNGMLVTVKARLLAQKRRGADQILELQADDHVFEALLESQAGRLQPWADGSMLAVTGICILETATSPVALARVLLRSPLDASVLRGPPWWTWQRTVTAIGLLFTVLLASLLRIELLKRRFSRQQASRLAFARGILESQESERRRIAASLHDSLGQNLQVIRSQAHLALQSVADQPGLRQRLEDISETTVEAINEVRQITHDLRPYQLDRLGLTQSIRAITRKLSESHPVSFACHVDEIDGVIGKDSEIHVYRIVQEGINNIVKHSAATEATVVIKNALGILSISIRDNGHGLTAVGAPGDAGFGLSGIRERAEIMGGSARVDSTPGQGVNLQIQIPIQAPTP